MAQSSFVRAALPAWLVACGWALTGALPAPATAVTRLAWQRQEWLPAPEPEDVRFWNAVRGLPAKQAQAVALFYLEDRPVSEIALVLDCSPATAKVHLHRGRQTLAQKLGEDPV